MITDMKLNQIIQLKLDGKSNREVARICNVDRKTVARRYNDYMEAKAKLIINKNDKEAKDMLAVGQKYDSSNRQKVKFTKEVEKIVVEMLTNDYVKIRDLGSETKLRLTNQMILSELESRGYNLSLTTVSIYTRILKERVKEAYIKQHYNLGDRAEFDFGEVKLIINNVKTKLYLAVFSSPASNYRFVRMYDNQGMEVFKDAHVKFFEEVGAVYPEVCYDNMRNVVSRFLGKSKKELNPQLVQLSNYYGFKINVTNAFSGNEKGHVEGSVKYCRNQLFNLKYRFQNFIEVQKYVEEMMATLNASSQIEKERKLLRPYMPPFETAEYKTVTVSKYSFIQINNCTYSVPEEYVGRKLIAKIYVDIIKLGSFLV